MRSGRFSSTTPLSAAFNTLSHARSYAEWSEVATQIDALTGAVEWRQRDDSPAYNSRALRSSILTLRALIDRGDARALAEALTESLYRHQGEVADPQLYGVALAGTKDLVEAYLSTCEDAMAWLARTPVTGLANSERKRRFQSAHKVFGTTALLLSGGATLGFHHLGVVKALFNQQLLPRVLSGASTGAMIAAGICTRNDAEITDLFANTDQMRLDGLKPLGWRRAWKEGTWLNPTQLAEVLNHNIGDRTFAEAFAHSGRALNISVSATRTQQKPRLLTHLTSPRVLVSSAALASSALPGLFPPVELQQRDSSGRVTPYIDGERWVDGSLDGDLPKLRLSRLHNANHFIVSQTNPHVLPFMRHRGHRGVLSALSGVISSTARTHGTWAADLARRATQGRSGMLSVASQQAYNLFAQDYTGHIDIHPQFHWALYKKVVSNPTRDDLKDFILAGERSVWPHIVQIRNETRIGRAFERALES